MLLLELTPWPTEPEPNMMLLLALTIGLPGLLVLLGVVIAQGVMHRREFQAEMVAAGLAEPDTADPAGTPELQAPTAGPALTGVRHAGLTA